MSTLLKITPPPLAEDSAAIIPPHPTVGELIGRTKAALSRMGNVGRFFFTHSIGEKVECYVTHWVRPAPHSPEICKAVGAGTVRECLDAIDIYADAFHQDHHMMSGADIVLDHPMHAPAVE